MADGSSRSEQYKRNRLIVLQRDNYTCVYCGREATEADHVMPVIAGGSDEVSNLVAACKPCNASKGKNVQTRLNWYHPAWLESL